MVRINDPDMALSSRLYNADTPELILSGRYIRKATEMEISRLGDLIKMITADTPEDSLKLMNTIDINLLNL